MSIMASISTDLCADLGTALQLRFIRLFGFVLPNRSK
jgi:hypothetical protein